MSLKRYPTLLGLTLGLTLLACDAARRSSDDTDQRRPGTAALGTDASVRRVLPKPTIRDSAGVRLIEYSTLSPMPPTWAAVKNPLRGELANLPPALQIDPRPFLSLGGLRTNPEEEFDASHPMLSATELTNGTIVVNDRAQLKFFTRTGRFLRAVGRKGMGPGEFQQTRKVCRFHGDMLLVVDFVGDRLTLWDANGEHIRTYPRIGRVHACHAGGALVVQDATVEAVANSAGDLMGSYALRRPDGTLVRELGMLPASFSAGGMSRSPAILPIGNELYIGNARVYEVQVQGFDGRIRRSTRITGPLVPISDEQWQQHAEAMVPRDATTEQRALFESFTRTKPFDYFPAFWKVRIDPVGRTWIQDFESAANWTVLDSSGVIMGRFEVPGAGLGSRSQLVGLGADYVVLLQEGAGGSVHLKFHHFTIVAD